VGLCNQRCGIDSCCRSEWLVKDFVAGGTAALGLDRHGCWLVRVGGSRGSIFGVFGLWLFRTVWFVLWLLVDGMAVVGFFCCLVWVFVVF